MVEKPEAKILRETVYTVPLKRAWFGPHGDRARKAVDILKKFMIRHMKAKEIKLDVELNELIWKRGMKNPPRKVKVRAVKLENGVVWVTLPDKRFGFEKGKGEERKEEQKEEQESEIMNRKTEGGEEQKDKKSKVARAKAKKSVKTTKKKGTEKTGKKTKVDNTDEKKREAGSKTKTGNTSEKKKAKKRKEARS